MNERLISPYYRNNTAVLGDAVVKFNKHGLCEGIVRFAGELPLAEPKPITAIILDEARKSPALFVVIPDPNEPEEEEQLQADTPDSEMVEVEGKAVVDLPQQNDRPAKGKAQ